MESLSFESTIESPTKPHQEKLPDKNNKSLFLVQVISDNKIQEERSQNLEINNIKENNDNKKCSNILNFDDVLSIIFPKEEPKKQEKKKCDNKLVGNKRKRPLKENKNKSKYLF